MWALFNSDQMILRSIFRTKDNLGLHLLLQKFIPITGAHEASTALRVGGGGV